MTGPEQHAATVREARKYIEGAQMGSAAVEQVLTRWDAALDELVALAVNAHANARLAMAAEAQANGWRTIAEDADGNLFVKRAEAAEARADELQAECHEWNALYGRLDKRRRDAEARADELQREIAKWRDAVDVAVWREREIGDQARREADQLRAALREREGLLRLVAEGMAGPIEARAALAGVQAEEGEENE